MKTRQRKREEREGSKKYGGKVPRIPYELHAEGASSSESEQEDVASKSPRKTSTPRKRTKVVQENGKQVVRHGRVRTAHKLNATTAKVVIKFGVVTAVACPCEDSGCKTNIRVGEYSRLATGSDFCVHCGKARKDGSPFRHASDLKRHIDSLGCRRVRGIDAKCQSGYHMLGIRLRHLVNAPENIFQEKNKSGILKDRFRCPKCKETRCWSKRYSHAVQCFPKHGLALPESAGNSEGNAAVVLDCTDDETGEESD